MSSDEQLAKLSQVNRQACIDRIVQWACKEKLGESRAPQTPDELEQVQGLVKSTIQRAGIFHIKPGVHVKQDLFWGLRTPIKLFCAGNQSGKSIGLLSDLGACLLGFRPWDIDSPPLVLRDDRPILCILAGPNFTNWAALNVVPKLKELLPWRAIVTQQSKMQAGVVDGFTLWNGNQCKIMSYQQEDSDFESWTIDAVFWDEPMPQGKYYAARRGSLAYKAPHVMAYTPRKEAWTYDAFKLPAYDVHSERTLSLSRGKEIACVHATSYDNPYIPKEEIERYERELPEAERRCRINGEYRSLQGLVYKTFDPTIHVRPLPWEKPGFAEEFDKWPKAMVVDPHDRKAFAIAWAAITPRNECIWFQNWPVDDFWRSSNPGFGVGGYANLFREIESGANFTNRPISRVMWRIMDPQFGRSTGLSSGRTLQEDFQDHGYDFDCSVDNAVQDGHLAVDEWLSDPPRMFWTPDCVNFIHAMQRYMYDEFLRETFLNQKEKPKEEYKDYPDLARYLVKSGVAYVDLDDLGSSEQEHPNLGR